MTAAGPGDTVAGSAIPPGGGGNNPIFTGPLAGLRRAFEAVVIHRDLYIHASHDDEQGKEEYGRLLDERWARWNAELADVERRLEACGGDGS